MSAKEKQKIVRDTPSKYHFKTKDDQQVNIEHKDRGIVLKLFKWSEEASLEIPLNIALNDKHQFSETENRIELDTTAFKLRVYPIDTRSTSDLYGDSDDVIQCEDGGVRFELVLKGKPPVNSFTVPLISKNLRFSYQPFLTQEDIDAGVRCPLNVEGSYAVYHTTKKNNQYMTGKAFHIYRPIAEDALGVKAWCSIHIDKYIDPTSLTVTIPQQFLDEATFPVTLDPDFGYTTVGASTAFIAEAEISDRVGTAWTMPAPGGTANYIRACVKGDVVADCKVFINQKDSGGVGTHAQIATKENLACAIAEHWEEFTLAGQGLTQAVNYILGIMAKGLPAKKYYRVKMDVNGAIASYMESQTYATPESPWVATAMATTWDYSIYCNYTEAAPPVTEGGLRMTLSLKGHMGYDLKTRGGKARRRMS